MKISQEKLADLLNENRPNIKKWMEDPELMPLGVYQKLQALGVEISTLEWHITACDFCDGRGWRLERRTA